MAPHRQHFYIAAVQAKAFKSVGDEPVHYEAFSPYLNAVVGANGAGKSNLLDAICFGAGCHSRSGGTTFKEMRSTDARASQTEVNIHIRCRNTSCKHQITAVLTPQGSFWSVTTRCSFGLF